jgi:predicted ATPase/DNA-binding SARP family transcriptional activator
MSQAAAVPRPEEMTTIAVLGPVEVRAPDRPPVVLPPSVRALFARLALAAGRVVSVDTLTDALWGEDLPVHAGNALQSRVSKLRRALLSAGVGGEVVVTRAPGYQLAVPADAVDAHRFERLVSQARTAAGAGHLSAALGGYDDALGLWRGPALDDVGAAEWVRAERARLEEMRLGASEDRLELLLELGRHTEAVAELDGLVAAHPLRERLHRLLMLGMYRGGRQADALAVYHRVRRRLADDLGIDPSPQLQALAEAILRQQVPDRRPGRASAESTASPAAGDVAPRQPHTRQPPPTDEQTDPVAGATGPRRRLPRRLASIVGRQDDVVATLAQLRACRVVTLTGPGGIGKTTLAMEVARQVDEMIADEVHLVRLAAVGTGRYVAEAFATQLGVPTTGPGAAAIDAVIDHLASRRALLVVDNCEHVIDEVATVVERLVAEVPDLRILATSREALAVPGETQLTVGPLAAPAGTEDVGRIGAAPAVRLFVDRARAVRPSFALDPDTAPLVAAICRQLDGMPLAIELAAARIKALPPAEIAARLSDRFALLTGGTRTSEARHRTLRATLDWSYELLSDAERRLLRRLAVFRGGWTVTAAEQVCGFAGLHSGAVMELLFRLVDRSLVVPDPATGRFRLLVTVREYANQRLIDAGEAEPCHNRHLEYYSSLAQQFGPLVRFGGTGWERISEEYDNLRAAVDRALEWAATDLDAGFRLAGGLMWFWMYGLRYDGVRAFTALLDAGGGSAAGRARALQALALLHIYYPTPQSRAAARESLALFEQLGDDRDVAISQLVIAWEAQYDGDADAALAMVADSRRQLGDADHGWWRAMTYYVEASLQLRIGAFDVSARLWRRSLDLMRPTGDRIMPGGILAHLGVALREAGRTGEALTVLGDVVDDARGVGALHSHAFALVQLAHTRLDLGDGDEVTALLREADEVARHGRNPRCQAWAAWGRARIAHARGDTTVALQQCRTALALLQDREFPWARARLWSLTADCAEAAGQPDAARQARDMGDAVVASTADAAS